MSYNRDIQVVEAAMILGVSKQTLHNYIIKGCPSEWKQPPRAAYGRYVNLDEVKQWMADNMLTGKGGKRKASEIRKAKEGKTFEKLHDGEPMVRLSNGNNIDSKPNREVF